MEAASYDAFVSDEVADVQAAREREKALQIHNKN